MEVRDAIKQSSDWSESQDRKKVASHRKEKIRQKHQTNMIWTQQSRHASLAIADLLHVHINRHIYR